MGILQKAERVIARIADPLVPKTERHSGRMQLFLEDEEWLIYLEKRGERGTFDEPPIAFGLNVRRKKKQKTCSFRNSVLERIRKVRDDDGWEVGGL